LSKCQKNIAIVSTGRADYGLLYPLIHAIIENNSFNLEVIATGTHLSPIHGMTITNIESDGIKVNERIEMTMISDSEDAICSSIAMGTIGFSGLYNRKKYDLIVVLGDRYELWSVCIPAVIHKIPIAHIHGGESTYGLIDDPIRHSVTKMASFHFASIDMYARRIIQMGERPDRVFTVGAIGLDNINKISLMEINELSEYAGVNFNERVALLTYHPVTLDSYNNAGKQIEEVLNALLETDLFSLITMPNSDTGGNEIFNVIKCFTERHPNKFKIVPNLGQRAYLSAMQYAKLMIGNSSSGIIEASSFKLPVVNIGDRQGGRYKSDNVIDCICEKESIVHAIHHAISKEFQESLLHIVNPYGNGNTANKIVKILENFDLKNNANIIKKGFFNFTDDFILNSISRII